MSTSSITLQLMSKILTHGTITNLKTCCIRQQHNKVRTLMSSAGSKLYLNVNTIISKNQIDSKDGD